MKRSRSVAPRDLRDAADRERAAQEWIERQKERETERKVERELAARTRDDDLLPKERSLRFYATALELGPLVLFFIVNGAIALWTALAASDATWALYNGLIAYGLMGAMFAGEWLLRPRHAG